ncbi:hypothetical protein LNP04_02925 [Chryseobacterium sp. C-71]|uniref:hypothetical protein n=1 Tax=Chryseobacterium sp. C-71 TaxID=2893882 RepID=UPI001E2DF977|nr:hypothetical protein [Chryseobacterium sp. C-71]UFH32685.1 hypothetical protein LNP04_02925 [Chryseobacterium sp. C-71]
MKINNKNNVRNIRFYLLFLYIILIIIAIVVLKGCFQIFMICIANAILCFVIFFNYCEFEYSGECISFKKYSVFKSGYIRPFVEMPVIYFKDFEIKRCMFTYILVITFDNGTSAKKNISLSLKWYNDQQITNITKVLTLLKEKINSEIS